MISYGAGFLFDLLRLDAVAAKINRVARYSSLWCKQSLGLSTVPRVRRPRMRRTLTDEETSKSGRVTLAPFVRLPYEIRLVIYSYCLRRGEAFDIREYKLDQSDTQRTKGMTRLSRYRTRHLSPHLLALPLTCRQM